MRNQKGNSLITVMIAMGVGALVMMATMASLTAAMKSHTSIELTIKAMGIADELALYLKDPVLCKSSLGGVSLPETGVTPEGKYLVSEIKRSDRNDIFWNRPNDPIKKTSTVTEITDVTLKNVRVMNSVAGTYSGKLEVIINKGNRQQFVGLASYLREIPMELQISQVAGVWKIQNCVANGVLSDPKLVTPPVVTAGTPIPQDLVDTLLNALKNTSNDGGRLRIIQASQQNWAKLGYTLDYLTTEQLSVIVDTLGGSGGKLRAANIFRDNLLDSSINELAEVLARMGTDSAKNGICRLYSGRITDPGNIPGASLPISGNGKKAACVETLVGGA